jgi:hypothetical protein
VGKKQAQFDSIRLRKGERMGWVVLLRPDACLSVLFFFSPSPMATSGGPIILPHGTDGEQVQIE